MKKKYSLLAYLFEADDDEKDSKDKEDDENEDSEDTEGDDDSLDMGDDFDADVDDTNSPEDERKENIEESKLSRKQEVIEIIKGIFKSIKLDYDFNKRFSDLNTSIDISDEVIFKELSRDIFNKLKLAFKEQFNMAGLSEDIFKIYPDVLDTVNIEFDRAYNNIINRIEEE
jgi:hypothetical protein